MNALAKDIVTKIYKEVKLVTLNVIQGAGYVGKVTLPKGKLTAVGWSLGACRLGARHLGRTLVRRIALNDVI